MDKQDEVVAEPNFIRDAVAKFMTPRAVPRTSRDEELLREAQTLDLSGSDLKAHAWGNGPSVLLAHGWDSRGTHWGSYISALVEAGFRAIAVDAPAHGDSPGERANVLLYALELLKASRSLGPLAGIVGHSFGAAASSVALHRGLNAERAVLLSGPNSLRFITEQWCRHHHIVESQIPHFVHLVELEVGEPIDSLEIARMAGSLSQPVLVVHDRLDEDIPLEEGLAVASAWPGSRLLITERYGHRRIMLAKEVVREVVAFLQERSNQPH